MDTRRRVTFANHQGDTLSGILDLPLDDQPSAVALFAHCFTCSKNLKAVRHISRALTSQGIAVLRFDFTGLGESEGEFGDTSFATNLDDLLAACEFLEREIAAPDLLIGHSLGGTAMLHIARTMDSVQGVATIGSPCDPAHVAHLIDEDSRELIAAEGEAIVKLAGRPFKIKRAFLEALQDTSPETVVGKLGKPLLLFHSPLDETVDVEQARHIYNAAKHPKSFISLDRADHLLTNEEDARYVGAVIAAWAQKYLPPREVPQPPHQAGEVLDAHEHQVVVRTGAQGFTSQILAAGHPLIADEPKSYGGDELGPSPYDLLMASLGSCTTMTLRMYADRKGIDLQAAIVRMTHRKIHANDCLDCETDRGKIDEIVREIELIGDIDEPTRQRMLEIADRCPVHRTLHGEVKIRSSLRE